MTFAVVLDVVVVALILYRQRMVRPVRPRLHLRLAGVLAIVGLIELLAYAGSRHVPAEAVGVLALSFVVGAVVLGAVRAATVKLWRVEGLVLRQGTWLTILLWLVSIGLHYGAQAWINALHGPSGFVSASLLLWLGVTYGVQRAVVHRRAETLFAAGGAIDAHADVVRGPGQDGWGSPARGTGNPEPSNRSRGAAEAIEVHAEAVLPATPPERRHPAGPGSDRPPVTP
jgi:hypothetical protein